jgi:uncharacterized membrane protein (UPF0182 family)
MESRNDSPVRFMRRSQIRNLILLALLLALILLALTSTIANFIIEYNWWKEVGQVGTWVSMLWYSIAPSVAGALVAFIALLVAHARGRDNFCVADHPGVIACRLESHLVE